MDNLHHATRKRTKGSAKVNFCGDDLTALSWKTVVARATNADSSLRSAALTPRFATSTLCQKVKIRRAELSEATRISAFVSELAATHVAPTLLDGGIEKLLESMDPSHTAQRIRDGYPNWIAEEGTEIIGVAAVKPPSHVYHLFVATNRQRKGIGRLLLHKAIRFISETHQSPMATVNASLNSIDAYRAFGFTTTSDIQVKDGVQFQPMSMATTPP